MDAGKWTHIVYAVDKDGGIKLYKNGELLETAAIPADKQSASADSGLPFLIGGGNNWHVGADVYKRQVYSSPPSGETSATLVVVDPASTPR